LSGLPETAVKESKDPRSGAILIPVLNFLAQRITVNLAPADLTQRGRPFIWLSPWGYWRHPASFHRYLDQYDVLASCPWAENCGLSAAFCPSPYKPETITKTDTAQENTAEAAPGLRILKSFRQHIYGSLRT